VAGQCLTAIHACWFLQQVEAVPLQPGERLLGFIGEQPLRVTWRNEREPGASRAFASAP
jgi:hypothetical protein